MANANRVNKLCREVLPKISGELRKLGKSTITFWDISQETETYLLVTTDRGLIGIIRDGLNDPKESK